MSTSFDTDWLISVDDHVLEPPHVWQDRVPRRFRQDAPRLVADDAGEAWVYDGKRIPSSGLSAAAGRSKEEFSPKPLTYAEMRPGCYDPIARLADMDRAGILASLCFPSFPRFCGQIFYEATDKDLALHCVIAYNDWMIDEWCASAPGRYIPMIILPLWDPTLAVLEIERCAEKGARAVAFSENPEPLGLPTIFDPGNYWEPVMAAAADNELVVCMHAGSSSQVPKLSADSPPLANLSWGATRASGAMLSWLFSGYFQRMPELKIALSEGGVGWMPYFLERAEQVIDKQRHWAIRGEATSNYGKGLKVLDNHLEGLDVRQLFRDHVYGCFIEDVHGAASIHEIGVDNVMVETDYPHTDSTWPDCFATAKKQLMGYTLEEQYKVLRGNAERLFRFTPAVV